MNACVYEGILRQYFCILASSKKKKLSYYIGTICSSSKPYQRICCRSFLSPVELVSDEAVSLTKPRPHSNLARASVSAMQNGEQLWCMGRVI